MTSERGEWAYQWTQYEDCEAWLFWDWIHPQTLESFRGKRVLDAGCGGGQHIRLVAPVAREVVGLDPNTAAIAADRLAGFPNVRIEAADAAAYRTDELFDVVYCVGVIHHTDDPERTFANLSKLCRAGGRLIVWCYAREGNGLMRFVVEPLRRSLLRRLPRRAVHWIAVILTALLYPVVHTLYRLPLRRLPYYDYFEGFRKLDFWRNHLNVFDKLNAPQTDFISRERVERWFDAARFDDVSISPYGGVSWRASGTLRRV